MLTILLGLVAAAAWGAPDSVLARGVRQVGPFPVMFGSICVGAVLSLPLVLTAGLPDLSGRALPLAVLVGVLTVAGTQAGFTGFTTGSVSVVAPIVSCEGGVAALLSLAAGERVGALILIGLPLALLGVVLVARGDGGGGAAGVVPAVIAALVWGCVLALSAPLAGDLGVVWAFVLVRLSAVAAMVPFALRTSALSAARRAWQPIAVWGVCDAIAYFSFVIAADRRPRLGRGRAGGAVRHGRRARCRRLLRRAPAALAGAWHRVRGDRRGADGSRGRLASCSARERLTAAPASRGRTVAAPWSETTRCG